MDNSKISQGALVMAGLIILGLMLPVTAAKFKSFDNIVSVKGLCEKEVLADKVIWPITFKLAGNDLQELYSRIESQTGTVTGFLAAGGISASAVTVAPPKISDKFTQEYGGNDRPFRYVATCCVTVCTDEVQKVLSLMDAQSELIMKGLAISSEWDGQPQFKFESLNEIKPEMIEEATKNARSVAQKFADDSGSRLGRIKDASQGTFSIEDRDSNTPSVKKVRVVTYVSYYLR